MLPIFQAQECLCSLLTGGGSFPVTDGGSGPFPSVQVSNEGNLHIFGGLRATTGASFFTTPGAALTTGPNFYTRFNSTGTPLVSSRWLNGELMRLSPDGAVHVYGRFNNNYPTTPGVFQGSVSGNLDYTLTRFNNYAVWNNLTNEISPTLLIACQGGDIDMITGNRFSPAGRSFLPSYQWQVSSVDPLDPGFDPATDWVNISGAVVKDYQPMVLSTTRWYRRLVLSNAPQSCSDENPVVPMYVLSASNVAEVPGSNLMAPVVDAGPDIYSCPGATVQIGGAPTASGGVPPYIYQWQFGNLLNDSTIANPRATVDSTTIFTVVVTDRNGCISSSQMRVIINKADAGPDISYCQAEPVRIGTLPIPNEPASYSWNPATNLSCSSCPRPFANPTVTTSYVLIKRILLPDNSSCNTLDTVTVTVVSPPTQQLSDVTFCYTQNNQVQLGYPAESGFSYTWAPGTWLQRNDTSSVLFNSSFFFLNNTSQSLLNPFTYQLTATRNNCAWFDTMQVFMIRADAGPDGCGPRTIGRDWHPWLPATYTWRHISGPNNLTGPTNQPVTTVGETNVGASVYELEVCLNNVCCTDRVTVTPCGCVVGIDYISDIDCPVLDSDSSNLTLIASGGFSFPDYDPADDVYTWTPCDGGLDTCMGRQVRVLTMDQRTYTVTISNPNRPNLTCTESFTVNDPSFSVPVFAARDTFICLPTDFVNIGNTPVAGYSYSWNGPGGFVSFISNPSVNVPGSYTVVVTDILTGCQARDTADVTAPADFGAGPDQTVCPGAVIEIGIPDQSGGTLLYSWFPAASPWRNGTDENSPQPQVFIATSQTFILTVTDPVTGCIRRDTVVITVDPNGPPLTFANDTSCGTPVIIGPPEIFGAVYSWSPATGLSCTDCANPTASPSSTTTDTVSIQPPGVCNPINGTVRVYVGDGSPLNLDPIEKCFQEIVALNPTLEGQCAGCTYSWSPASRLSNPSVINPTTLANSDIEYVLTVTDALGCQREGTVAVTITDPAELTLPDIERCPGGAPVNINPGLIGQCAGCTYEWSPATGLSSTSVINPTTSAGSATYTLTVLKPDGCLESGTVNVGLPTAPDAGPNADICVGESILLGSANNSPSSTYTWSPATGLNNPSLRQPTFTATAPGVYVFTVVENRPGFPCQLSNTVTITVGAAVVAEFDNLFILCENSCVQIGPPPVAGQTYTWSPSVDLSCSDCANPLACPQENRSYVLTVTQNSTGCFSQFNVGVNLTDVQPPVLTLSNTLACIGDIIPLDLTVSPAGDYDFLWQPPTGLSSATVQNPTLNTTAFPEGVYTYTVNVSDNVTGCTGVLASSEITIEDCTILPVELLSFEAAVVGGVVELDWSTASEFNNDRFEIQRSSDARNWSYLGMVPGANTSNTIQVYSYTDERPLKGISYYRLKQFDFDGTAEYSQIRSVEISDNTVLSRVSWYPNPARNNLTVNTNGRGVNFVLITDALGRQVAVKDLSMISGGNVSLQFDVLPSGLYQISFIGDNFIQTDKLIIQQ